VAASGGHIQSLVNPPGNPRSRYRTGDDDLHDDPETWMHRATEHAGTWWDDWLDWLETRSGATKVAPTRLGAGSHPALAPAPGRLSAWRTLLSPARYYLPGHYERCAADFLGGRIGRDPVLAHRYGETRRAHPPRPVGHLYQLCGGATWTNLPCLHRIQAPT